MLAERYIPLEIEGTNTQTHTHTMAEHTRDRDTSYCEYVLFRIYETKNTDRVFLWYWYGNYREIPTDTNQKIPIRDATLHFWNKLCEQNHFDKSTVQKFLW